MSVAAPRASDPAAAMATKAEERRAIGITSGTTRCTMAIPT